VYPFSDPHIFDVEISKPWQESDQQGVLSLKKLVNSVTLCRSRAAINLPKRVDEIHRLEFSAAERTIYNSARDQTALMLENAICEDYTQRGLYLNALRWLNTLRYICNHGVVSMKQKDPKDKCLDDEVPSSTWNSEAAQKAFNSMIEANAAICIACTSNVAEVGLESSEERPEESSCPVNRFGKARLSACLFVLCDSCASRCSDDSQQSPCSHEPKCATFDVYSPGSMQTLEQSKSGFEMDPSATPTKLKALVENLKSLPGEKRFACLHDILHIILR
jgi:SWI/SNF-related matrix-associated actin-dependent regulator of chromatin subfamily A3